MRPSSFGGDAIGFDAPVSAGLRLGVFTGGVHDRCAFASFGAASFLGFALHGGGSDNRASRTIANNLAAGGFETAQANYRSWYVSPELAYGMSLPLSAQYTLAPSVRVRYVAGLFDGYTESGSSANLTVAGRTIQDVEERGEVKLTHTMAFTPSDMLLTSIHVGVLGIHRLGDTTVNTVLLGQGLPFVTPGKDNVAGLFGGVGFDWPTHGNVSFFGTAEFTAMSDSSSTIAGKGGVRVAF